MKKARLGWALASAVALIVAGCGDSGKGNENAYILGFSSDLSGAFANLGRPILAGTQAYFERVNREGGINGHPIRLEVRDDRLDVQTAQADIRELADMGVPVILGNVSSVVWATTATLAEQVKVPQIAGGAVDSFVYPPQPYLYRYLMSARQAAEGQLRFALDQAGGQEPRIALIRYESAGTDAWEKAMLAALERVGIDPSSVQQFPADATEVSPATSAVAGSSPDWVLGVLNDPQAPLVVDALRNRGYRGPIVNWVGVGEPTVQAVRDSEFYVIRDVLPVQAEETATMMADAQAAGVADDMTHDYATHGYLTARLVAETLADCGFPCDGPSFEKALLAAGAIDTQGLAGPGYGDVGDDSHLFPRNVSVWRLAPGAEQSTLVGDWFEPTLDRIG